MESEENRSEKDRARKRRKKEIDGEGVGRQEGLGSKRRAVETRSKAFVGRYVKKEFEGNGVFLGKVVSYSSGLYRVDYEDGDCEDLECGEVREFLVEEGDFDEELNTRKTKLDQLILMGGSKTTSRRTEQNAVVSANDFSGVEASSFSKLSSNPESGFRKGFESDTVQLDGDADSSSDSCEYVRVRDPCSETESPTIPSPPLPLSSGSICVPEESVSHLFSVYNFLRSFSIQLFLSPFGLDDFVGALNCVAPNTLLDGIHVALMRALRRHLEMLSSDGLELAIKCLRRIDWSLLDTLTWPVYLVEYFLIMGYTKEPVWKGFYNAVLDKEYYTLSVARKLIILQILCDDILESAELRAEIDVRESLEVGTDSDGTSIPPPGNGPRRVHPRYSKTSACKDPQAMEITSEAHVLKLPCDYSSLGSKDTELDTNDADVDQDGNSDECRLCGMDGTLICCDGCPSAYHSRCIGLNKMLLPEGSWYCPECTINKKESILRIGMGLRGADVFGIDQHGQVFLGTCNHLLVLKTLVDEGTSTRYYNQNDIPKVLQILCSSIEYTTLYSGICKSIKQYWTFLDNLNFSCPTKTEIGKNLADEKEEAMVSTPSYAPSGKETCKLLDATDGENCASSVTESNVENGTLSGGENDCQEAGLNGTSIVTMCQADLPSLKKDADVTTQHVCQLTNAKLHEHFGIESTLSTGSVILTADLSELTHQSLAGRSVVLETATCTSENRLGPNKEDADSMALPVMNSLFRGFSENREVTPSVGAIIKGDMVDDCSYMGLYFKPQAYVNQYILGDVAASAAANLAVLSSEENRVSEANTSSNPRKHMSANISLQVKAFSSAVFRVFWPNSEKKLMEVPRERCGWCLSCKAPASSKKGCLLNSAASNALRAAGRILSSFRSIKNGEGNLSGIAAYILYMEESLRGLTVGPFLTASYRKRWRKQVEEVSTCTALKFLLLELEENIRLVALSGGWVKLVDGWSVDSSVALSSMFSVGPTQKRGPGGKRNRKHSAASEITADTCEDKLKDVSWWRGGKLSKLVFQRGSLPCKIAKKAARQGGSRKISGVYYAEGSQIPKRSRRFAWRVAVEMSKNASQLALQVRYLDLHVRWIDLVRPEQNFQDGKATETEASVFRNALICDKKIQENKIRYGLAFGIQKHLPSRFMKNIIEIEQIQDGQEKFWFSETHIPLYLIKEYEEKAEKLPVPSTKKASHVLSKLQRRQLKASRKDIFSYLMRKKEKLDKCFCASCQKDVLLSDAVKCSACQGYCHRDCTISSTVQMKGEVEFLITCNQCYCSKVVMPDENSKSSLIGQVSLQRRENQTSIMVTKGAQQNGYGQPLLPVQPLLPIGSIHSDVKPSATRPNSATRGRRGTVPSYGLIKKKKNSGETGTDFRLKNILFRGNVDTNPWLQPVCFLCSKPYNSDLMYICCEACGNWYHADAIQLKESQIFDVVGFKCMKCRRKSSPPCPYMDPECRESRTRTSKQGSTIMDPASGTFCEQLEGWEITTPVLHTKMDEVVIEEEDPLLFSLERVELITDSTSEVGHEWNTSGAQKLPVRRHVKREKDVDVTDLNPSQVESTPLEANNPSNTTEKSLSPQVNWEIPIDDFKDEMVDYEGGNYEDMEFEPQTYFSFTELLESEDNQLDPFDASMDVSGNCGKSAGYGANTSDNPPERYEPPVTVPCQMCLHTEPAPGLCCEICGIWIHNHCSPWVESSSLEGRWRCGQCRDWR